jgi:transcriptional antiterminator NusG
MTDASNNPAEETNIPTQDTKWYVLRVVSGKEKKVKEYLDIEVRRSDWGNVITQIFLPVEKVYKCRQVKR